MQESLHTALACCDIAGALSLVNDGADVYCRDEDSRTPLHKAAAMGSKAIELVELLLMRGADVNVTDSKGDTPLHFAAYDVNLSVVQLLIEYGASVRSKNRHFLDTPLHRAALNDQKAQEVDLLSVIELFVASGADVNAEVRKGNTPLLIHCAAPNVDISVVRSLIEFGASVNCRDKYTMESPLHRVAKKRHAEAIIRLLLENGANIDAKDRKDNTPLHLAVGHGNEANARSLINFGASVHAKVKHCKETPLHRAVINNVTPEMIELLLENGANLSARDYMGNTPLHRLFNRWTPGSHRVLEMLFINGACVNMQNYGGQSALFYVQSTRQTRSDCAERNLNLLLSQHGLKLKAAKLPLSGEYGAYVNKNHDQTYYDECSAEIERLKSVFIDGSMSLYDFLRACPGLQDVYVRNKKLQKMIESDNFLKQFPEYSALVRVSYRNAVIRRSLLKSAEKAWYQLTNFQLPDCDGYVFAYMTSVDLANIIEASTQLSDSIDEANDGSKRRRLEL